MIDKIEIKDLIETLDPTAKLIAKQLYYQLHEYQNRYFDLLSDEAQRRLLLDGVNNPTDQVLKLQDFYELSPSEAEQVHERYYYDLSKQDE